jgi:predicted nucleic acid-binding protein
MTYALDTNIISYLIKDDKHVKEQYELAVTSGHRCIIPLIAYYEVKRGLISIDAYNRMRLFEELCGYLDVEKLTIADADTAATLYAAHRRGLTIFDSDLIIAAQCITREYTLVTHNVRHFERIGQLRIVDWVS